jgi:hypothetical protein
MPRLFDRSALEILALRTRGRTLAVLCNVLGFAAYVEMVQPEAGAKLRSEVCRLLEAGTPRED